MVHIAKNPAYQEAYAQRTTRDAAPLVAQALATTTGTGRSDTTPPRLPGTEAGVTAETGTGLEAGQANAAGQGTAASEAAWTSQSGCSGCGCGCGGDEAGDSNSPEAGLDGVGGNEADSGGFDQESITPPISDSIEPVE